MTRPARIDPEGGIHHVYSRGTKRWTIFLDDIDRRRFLGLLSRACDRYGLGVIAFCLMDNHFHLVLRCPDAGLSSAMRDVKSLYARSFNTRHLSSGPIFEDRFGSKLVRSPHQLRELVRYVHRNPLSIDTNMQLASYPWSSHGMYVGVQATPVWMEIDTAASLFTNYRSEVERPRLSDKVQNQLTPNVAVPPLRLDTATMSVAGPSLSVIVAAVARVAGRDVGDVRPTLRNGLVGLALMLGTEFGYSCQEMYEPLGYHQVRTAQRALQRAQARVATDDTYLDTLHQGRWQLKGLAA